MSTTTTSNSDVKVWTPETKPLLDAIERCQYKDWKFELKHGFIVAVTFIANDNFGRLPRVFEHHFGAHIREGHPQPVEFWERFLFDCVIRVEMHEAMELFHVNGERPFNPHREGVEGPYVLPGWPQ